MPDRLSIEGGAASAGVIAELTAMGHEVREGRAASQGEAHSIVYDAATRTAMAAADKRGSNAGVGVPNRARRP
jgi:hypothetical protein